MTCRRAAILERHGRAAQTFPCGESSPHSPEGKQLPAAPLKFLSLLMGGPVYSFGMRPGSQVAPSPTSFGAAIIGATSGGWALGVALLAAMDGRQVPRTRPGAGMGASADAEFAAICYEVGVLHSSDGLARVQSGAYEHLSVTLAAPFAGGTR